MRVMRTAVLLCALVLPACAPASIRLPVPAYAVSPRLGIATAAAVPAASPAAASDSACPLYSAGNFFCSCSTPVLLVLGGGSGIASLAAGSDNPRWKIWTQLGALFANGLAGASATCELWTRAALRERCGFTLTGAGPGTAAVGALPPPADPAPATPAPPAAPPPAPKPPLDF